MRILCLDFDGVLHSYKSGWQGARVIPDPPVPGAMEFLVNATTEFDVHIFSARSGQWGGRRAMRRWLLANLELYMEEQYPDLSLEEDLFREPQLVTTTFAKGVLWLIKFPRKKPPAFVSIDDRCLTFTGKFPKMMDLRKFTPWNKEGV